MERVSSPGVFIETGGRGGLLCTLVSAVHFVGQVFACEFCLRIRLCRKKKSNYLHLHVKRDFCIILYF